MKELKKHFPFFTIWTGFLAVFLYFAFVKNGKYCFNSWLFLLCILTGVAFDFLVCQWKHFFDKPDNQNKSDEESQKLLSKIEYHYQCYDKKWNNLFWENFLLFIALYIHGIIVYLVVMVIGSKSVNPTDFILFFGFFIPYFFHKAYYFAIRIPEFKQSVYVYYKNINEIQTNINQVALIGKKISELEVVPRDFEGWLFKTRVIFTDNEINATNKDFIIPCINQSWSYRQLMDIIFYQKNHSEDDENFYKTEWKNEIRLFSGNDKLVRTCWEVTIDTGSSGSGIPIHVERIGNFSAKEFSQKKVKVNGLLTIQRTL